MSRPQIENSAAIALPQAAGPILQAMFRRYARIVLAGSLGGGYSGSLVLRVIPFRSSGIPELPAVVKLGPEALIRGEARAYCEHIRGRLAAVPEVWGEPVVAPDGGWAGLRYAMVGSGLFENTSLERYSGDAATQDLIHVLCSQLFVVFDPLWRHGQLQPDGSLRRYYDSLLPVNLVVRPLSAGSDIGHRLITAGQPVEVKAEVGDGVLLRGFCVQEVDAERKMVILDVDRQLSPQATPFRLRLQPVPDVGAYVGGQPCPPTLGVVTDTRATLLADGFTPAAPSPTSRLGPDAERAQPLPDPLDAVEDLLDMPRPMRTATVHGDLNLQNVLVDPEARTVRIIDFAQSGESHALIDLVRLESGIVTHLLPEWIDAGDEGRSALLRLYGLLHEAPAGLPPGAAERKLLAMMAAIRQAAAPLLAQAGDWREYYAALTLCLLASGKYRNLGLDIRRLAFTGAAAALQLSKHDLPVHEDSLALALGQGAAAPLPGGGSTGNLPILATRFIGRADDLRNVSQRLTGGRLVTLMGPGGVGKTRLAIEAARAVSEHYRDGAWLLDLAPARTGHALEQAVSAALAVPEASAADLRRALINHLAPQDILLLFDNCEQIIDECADLIADLLLRCPGVRILATSRHILRVPGEQVWAVRPFAIPDPGAAADPTRLLESSAIRLFVERAQNVQAGFSLDATNAAAVVSICRRLDGLPLAVELAAARVRMLSPQQIAARLDDRFRLLRDGLRSRTAHHVSLEETIAWSYELMSRAEQALLDRLSIFVGGFTLASAEAVCADETAAGQADAIDPLDVLDLLTSLVDKSLVSPSDERAVIQRFLLLDSIRAYGRRRLAKAGLLAEIASRHAAHFAALAVEAGAAIGGPDADRWMGHLQREHDNLAAAIAQLVEQGDAAAALGFCDALGEYWQVRGHLVEGRDWSEKALALTLTQPQPELRDRVVRIAGNLAFEAGDFTAARSHYESALATADASGDKAAMATARRNLGKVLDELGDYDQASMLQQASLAIMLELGDRWGEAAARNNLGLLDLHRGSPASALDHLTASLTIFRELDIGWAVGVALTNIAVAQLDRGMYDQAQAYLEEALALTRRLGDRVGQAYAATVLGAVASRAGRIQAAREHFAESHPLLREIEDGSAVLEWLEYVAELAKLESRPAQAAVLLGAASTLRQDLRKPVYPRDRDQQQALLDDLRQALGAAAFDAAWAEGRALHWTQALERGLTTA